MLAMCMLLCASLPVQAQPPAEIRTSVAAYRALYEPAGGIKTIPKALLFAADGQCVGVTTADSTPAPRLSDYAKARLQNPRKACDIVASDVFGVAEVGGDSRRARPLLIVVALDQDFCTACQEYLEVARRSADWQGVDVRIVLVDPARGAASS